MPRGDSDGINSSQEADALGYLHSAGRALSSSQLAAALGYRRVQTVTDRLNSLEKRGLVERRRMRLAEGGSLEDYWRLTRSGHKTAKSEHREDAIDAHPAFASPTQVPFDAKFVLSAFPSKQRGEHDRTAVEYALTLAHHLTSRPDRRPCTVRWTAERDVPLPPPPGGWLPKGRGRTAAPLTATHYDDPDPGVVTILEPYASQPLSFVRPDATVVEYFHDAEAGEPVGVEYLVEFVKTMDLAKLRDKLRNYDAMFCSWAAHVPHWGGAQGFVPVVLFVVRPEDLGKVVSIAESVCIGKVTQRVEKERFKQRRTPNAFPGRARIFLCATTAVGNVAADLRAKRSVDKTRADADGGLGSGPVMALGPDPSGTATRVELLEIARRVMYPAAAGTTPAGNERDSRDEAAETLEATDESESGYREKPDISTAQGPTDLTVEESEEGPAQGHLF